jgi:hypothetical protein
MGDLDLSRTRWRKSSYSSANGQCVEVAHLDQEIAVRDSKNPGEATLVFSAGEWDAFVAGVKAGEFD